MYKVLGNDQKVYGPVSLEQIRQWQVEGRLNGATLLQAGDSTDWKPLSSLPGFNIPPPVAMPPAIPVPQTNGMAIAGLIFGVLANLCAFGFIFPALGVLFSAIALSRRESNAISSGKSLAIAGLVLSIIGMAWHGVVPFFWFRHHWHRW